MDVIKVSGSSRTSAVARALPRGVPPHKQAPLQAHRARARNKAGEAPVLARGYLKEDGYDVICAPEFADVEIDGKIRTAVKLVVELRGAPGPPAEAPPAEAAQ